MAKKKPEAVNKVVDELKKEILAGKYGESGVGILPPSSTLQERFAPEGKQKAGRETITRAVQHLRAMGLVFPMGRNIIIDTPNLKIPGVVPTFDKWLQERGLEAEVKNEDAPSIVELSADLAERFKLPVGTQSVRRYRLQGARRGKIVTWFRLAETYYLRELVDDEWLEQIKTTPKFVVIDAIKTKTGKFITHAHSELINRFPDEQEQALLDITYQTPVTEHLRKCYSEDETLIMFNRIILVSNKFTFEFDYPITL